MKKKWLDDEVKIMQFEQFNNLPWLGHGFTTRIGGVSAPPFNSFNLGKNTKDTDEALGENYSRLIKGNEVENYRIFLTNQVHGDTIQCVAYESCNENGMKIFDETDGLMTDESGNFLMSFYADCTPLFFVDKKKRVVAVSHAGWKGTCKNIGKKTVELMIGKYGSCVDDILVGIGPSAGLCCYEVGYEVIQQLEKEIPSLQDFYEPKGNGKYLVDIKKANVASIISAGVKPMNIEVSVACTICNEDYFSYRREGITGRMSGYIFIKTDR